jgi:hypothetical protein
VRPADRPGRFGRIDFQLMLLRRMADYQPGLVEDKLRDLGFARSEARAAHRRWQEIVRSRSFPGGAGRYRIVLGRPARTIQREFGDLTCEITQWELELWPGLWFETIAVPGGAVVQDWLVRAGDCAAPDLATVADLRPWGCVVGEVERRFGAVRHAGDEAPTRWSTEFTDGDGDQAARYLARFTWGLLQTVEQLPADSTRPGDDRPA